jgi:hypothetical protein
VYTGVAGGNRTNGRPQLEEVLKDLADRRADALIVTKLDRVSRSVVDFGSVLTSVRSCLPWSRMILSDGAGKQWGPGGCRSLNARATDEPRLRSCCSVHSISKSGS